MAMDMTDLQSDGAQDTEAMTPPPEPRRKRNPLDYKEGRGDYYLAEGKLAEAAGAPLREALERLGERHHSLSDDPVHQGSVFQMRPAFEGLPLCEDYVCAEARAALTATHHEPSQEWAGLQPAWHGGEPAPAHPDLDVTRTGKTRPTFATPAPDRCDETVNNGMGEPTECGRTLPCEYHDEPAPERTVTQGGIGNASGEIGLPVHNHDGGAHCFQSECPAYRPAPAPLDVERLAEAIAEAFDGHPPWWSVPVGPDDVESAKRTFLWAAERIADAYTAHAAGQAAPSKATEDD